jgi:hypothetical protein
VDEGDLEAEHAATGGLVDELGTRIREMCERSAKVQDLVGDVVHARTTLGEETADGRVVAERGQQLETTLSHPDRHSLDALLLDPRAMLESRAEEALVGVERAIEILDRETDVVHGARRRHPPAIVFERLAGTMRASLLALVVAAGLLAGCGSGSSSSSNGNGEASKSPAQVLAAAKTAASSASSTHVAGNIDSAGTKISLDLSMARGKGAKGSMSTNGSSFDLIRVGDTLYIHGSDAFWRQNGGPLAAQLLHGKWLKASGTSGKFSSLAALTNIGLLLGKVNSTHGKLVNDGQVTYKGAQAVRIRDTSDNSTFYVAATGKPYPVALVGGKANQSGTITFGDWNKHVVLTVPSNAIDLSKVGG